MLYSPWISLALSWKFIVFNPSTISYQLHTVKKQNQPQSNDDSLWQRTMEEILCWDPLADPHLTFNS